MFSAHFGHARFTRPDTEDWETVSGNASLDMNPQPYVVHQPGVHGLLGRATGDITEGRTRNILSLGLF